MSHIAVEIADLLPAGRRQPAPGPAQTNQRAASQSDSGEQREALLRGSPKEMRKVLMITTITGAGNCAASLGKQLNMIVVVAGGRRESLAALRGQEYAAVIVDDAIAESDPRGGELLRGHAGAAVVLEVNFAISGVGRLARQVRAEMQRREIETSLAMRLACSKMASELRETIAGLLLSRSWRWPSPAFRPSYRSSCTRLYSWRERCASAWRDLTTEVYAVRRSRRGKKRGA